MKNLLKWLLLLVAMQMTMVSFAFGGKVFDVQQVGCYYYRRGFTEAVTLKDNYAFVASRRGGLDIFSLNLTKIVPTIIIPETEAEVGETISLFSAVENPNNEELEFVWEIDGKKFYDEDVVYSFSKKGTYTVKLTVNGETATTTITVKNQAPTVKDFLTSKTFTKTGTFTSYDFAGVDSAFDLQVTILQE